MLSLASAALPTREMHMCGTRGAENVDFAGTVIFSVVVLCIMADSGFGSRVIGTQVYAASSLRYHDAYSIYFVGLHLAPSAPRVRSCHGGSMSTICM